VGCPPPLFVSCSSSPPRNPTPPPTPKKIKKKTPLFVVGLWFFCLGGFLCFWFLGVSGGLLGLLGGCVGGWVRHTFFSILVGFFFFFSFVWPPPPLGCGGVVFLFVCVLIVCLFVWGCVRDARDVCDSKTPPPRVFFLSIFLLFMVWRSVGCFFCPPPTGGWRAIFLLVAPPPPFFPPGGLVGAPGQTKTPPPTPWWEIWWMAHPWGGGGGGGVAEGLHAGAPLFAWLWHRPTPYPFLSETFPFGPPRFGFLCVGVFFVVCVFPRGVCEAYHHKWHRNQPKTPQPPKKRKTPTSRRAFTGREI